MRFLAFLLAFISLAANAVAYKYQSFELDGEGSTQVRACHMAVFSAATFCQGQSGRGFLCYCSNKNAMATLSGCIKSINKKPKSVFKWFVDYCKEQNVTVTTKNLTDSIQYLKDNGKNFTEIGKTSGTNSSSGRGSGTRGSGNSTRTGRSGATASSTLASGSVSLSASATASATANSTASGGRRGRTGGTRVDYPVYPNHTSVMRYYIGYRERFGSLNWAYWFSNALYAYWAFVFVVAGVCNWSVVIFPKLRTMSNGRISKAWRKYVTLPALIKKKKANSQQFLGVIHFLIPSRFETLVFSGFFWMTFLFNAIHMPYTPGSPLFSTKCAFILRTVSDKTGIIGTLLLPLLIMLSGRNNLFQWITRWKYSTFVLYHRWVGRTVVALVFVHSIAYGVVEYHDGEFASTMRETYVIYGILGTVAGVIMCFQGLLFIRRRFYELFLGIHILMAIAFIVGTWFHIRMRTYMEWLYASIAVWSFERLVRIARMVSFGTPNATVTLLSDECLRVVVPKPKSWPTVPGGHAWIYFFHSWYFWQSHPFTFLYSTDEKDKIVFVLKTKKGATHYLTKKLSKSPNKTCTIRVCVEGPYGEACAVKQYDNAVFIAGGNGIPGMFSESYELARKSVDNAKQRIKLIWAVREISTIEWIWEELHALKNTKVEATIYVTRSEGNDDGLFERMLTMHATSSSSSSSLEKESISKEGKDLVELLNEYFPHITFKFGRPSMASIVDEETEEATNSAAFITCGHPLMVDDLRYAIVKKIDQTEKRVDFFEQLQVWA